MNPMVPAAPGKRRSLADVLTSSLEALSGAPNVFDLVPSDRIVVVLVDGLGVSSLRARAGHARHLAERLTKATTITSGFPSTTAAALASLTTGLLPGEHGLVGYRVLDRAHDRVVNQLNGWDHEMRPSEWQPHTTVFESAAARGVAPVAIGPARYASSGFSEAVLRGVEYVSASSLAARFRQARTVLDRGGRQLVYLYVPELDMAAHARGWQSESWLSALETLDSAVAELSASLDPREGLLVTADHGVVDVDPSSHVLFEDGPLTQGLVHVAGDPRCLQLHLEPGLGASAREDFLTAWREAESARAWVATREEIIESGWFGAVPEQNAMRMGDVFVAARKTIAYYDGRDATEYGRGMIGQHGSFSPEELQVPLIGFGSQLRG